MMTSALSLRSRCRSFAQAALCGLLLMTSGVVAHAQTVLPTYNLYNSNYGSSLGSAQFQVVNPVANKLYSAYTKYVEITDLRTNKVTFLPVTATGIEGMSVDPMHNTVWGITGDGAINVIDGVTDIILTTIPGIQLAPSAFADLRSLIVAPVQGTAFAVSNTNVLYAYSTTTYRLLGQLQLPQPQLNELAVNPQNGYLYALTNNQQTGSGHDQLTQIPAAASAWASGAPTFQTISIKDANDTSNTGRAQESTMAVNPVTGQIIASWVSGNGDFGYGIFQGGTTLTQINTFNAAHYGDGTNPQHIATDLNPVTNFAYFPDIMNQQDNRLGFLRFDVINLQNNQSYFLGSLDAGVNHQQSGGIFDSTMNRLYLGDTANPSVLRIFDGSTANSFDQIGSKPTGMDLQSYYTGWALNPVTHRLFWLESLPGSYHSFYMHSLDEASISNTGKITVGANPYTMAVNTATHRGYVTNGKSNTVSVVDTLSNTVIATIAVGTNPSGVDVNPVNNRIYVANTGSNTVSILSGATNAVLSTVNVGSAPRRVEVNTVTGNVYVANTGSSSVSVISTGGTVSSVAVGSNPQDIAIDSARGLIYVANAGSSSVSVLLGSNTVASTISVGSSPMSLAIDSANNRIYVANLNDNTVTAIEGGDGSTSTINVGNGPISIALNPLTRRLYVANSNDGTISVIDGATNTVSATVNAGRGIRSLAVDPRSNRIFGANYTDGTVTILEGATNTPELVNTNLNSSLLNVVVEGTTGTAYAINNADSFITSIAVGTVPSPYNFSIAPATDTARVSNATLYETQNATPSFTVDAKTTFTSGAGYQSVTGAQNPAVTAIYYAVDSAAGSWTPAITSTPNSTTGGNTFTTAALPALTPGLHTLYVFAGYGHEGGPQPGAESLTSNYGMFGNEPQVSQVVSYTFQVDPVPTATSLAAAQRYTTPTSDDIVTATVTPLIESTGNISFTDTVGATTFNVGTSAVSSYDGTAATPSSWRWTLGTHTVKGTFASTAGFAGSSGTTTIISTLPDTTSTTVAALPGGTLISGTAVTLVATVTNTGTYGNGTPTGAVTFYDSLNNGSPTTVGTVSVGSNGSTSGFSYAPTSLGSHKITANYASDNTTIFFQNSSDTTGKTFVVGSAQTISFPQPTTPVTNGSTPATLTATASSGLAVTYTVTSGPATVSGSTLTFTGTGTVVVTANQAGNSQYAAASPVSVSISVTGFGNTFIASDTNLGSSSNLVVALTFAAKATLHSTLATAIQVVTQGRTNLDFTYTSGGGCTAGATYNAGQTCTVNVTFKPTTPGARIGGVVLYNNAGTPVAVAKSYISGTGIGPLLVASIGSATTPVTGLTNASAVAVDAAGTLYYTDQGTGKVWKNVNGTVTQLATGINTPTGIAVDGLGNVFFTAYGSNQLMELVGGAGSPAVVGSVNNPDFGLAVDGAGNVYTSGPQITKFAAGTFAKTALTSGLGSQPGVAVDAAGNVYTADFTTGRIYKIAPDTSVNASSSPFIVDPAITKPRGITVDAAGNLYLADQSLKMIRRIRVGVVIEPSTLIASGSSFNAFTLAQNGDLYIPLGSSITRLARANSTADFGSVTVGDSTGTLNSQKIIQFENDGNDKFTGSGITLSNSSDFSRNIPDRPCENTTLARGYCNVMLFFQPTIGGALSSTLTIASSSSVQNPTIQATGTGIKASQTISFVAPTIEEVFSAATAPITLNATASSGLPVSYEVKGPATLKGNVLTFTGAGDVTVTAKQVGNASFAAATPVQLTFDLDPAFDNAMLPEGATGTPQTLTLTFSSSFKLAAIQAKTKPVNAGAFNILTGANAGTCTVGTTYNAGDMCTVRITFTPRDAGLIIGYLQLLDPTSTVQLTVPMVSLRFH